MISNEHVTFLVTKMETPEFMVGGLVTFAVIFLAYMCHSPTKVS